MGRLWREHIKQYLGWILLAIGCMVIMAIANAFSAYMMRPIVDDVFVTKNEAMLWPVGLIVVATFFCKGMANYGQAMLLNFVGLKIIADTQKKLFEHLTKMEVQFFVDNPTGQLISRFTIDVAQMKLAVSNGLTGVGRDLMSLIGLVGVMFYQDWKLAVASFFVFPIAVIPIVKLGKRIRKVTANTQQEMGVFSTVLHQTFQGIRVVKAYSMEVYETSKVSQVVDRVRKLNMQAARTRELSRPIMETLGGVAIFIVIIYGGSRVIDNETTAGAFFSFITALLMAYEPMKRLANLNASIQEGMASAQRLFMVLDREPQIQEPRQAREFGRAKGEIRLEKIRFSYSNEQRILSDLSIHVPVGHTVALVGASGSGKSTILNLIPRFYEVNEGFVSIDGINVRNITFESLYQNIALVSQEVTLFDDTVSCNIAYGRLDASQNQIEKAAKSAAAHEFITALPEGYNTVVGEHGIRLSGGQRQRLAIARAVLKNAPILLLDEATSALDTESEQYVKKALDSLMMNRTTLVIAHRLSTVTDADKICVIENGRVMEEGTHNELLEKKGVYKRLYELQFAEQNNDGFS